MVRLTEFHRQHPPYFSIRSSSLVPPESSDPFVSHSHQRSQLCQQPKSRYPHVTAQELYHRPPDAQRSLPLERRPARRSSTALRPWRRGHTLCHRALSWPQSLGPANHHLVVPRHPRHGPSGMAACTASRIRPATPSSAACCRFVAAPLDHLFVLLWRSGARPTEGVLGPDGRPIRLAENGKRPTLQRRQGGAPSADELRAE
jgi:hypothetical protein